MINIERRSSTQRRPHARTNVADLYSFGTTLFTSYGELRRGKGRGSNRF
jgi:hypothetical protein